MKLRNSRVLREMRQGRVATCAKINLSDPRVIELCGLAGFSAAWMCMEHVPNDWTMIENCIRAGKIHDMDVIVRIARGSYSDYIRPFECDAAGVMIPHVESADQAREIVDFCRFAPIGRRALDGGNVDGAFCQAPLKEYLHHANHERLLILQIESPEALENVEKIAQVPGYDLLMFGAGDFSHRIGKPGEFGCPEVTAARKRIEEAAAATGKTCFAVGVQAGAAELLERGYSVTNLASDVYGLGQYLAAQAAAFASTPEANENGSQYSAQPERGPAISR
jgi:4-hydroxy-2-oxoheptanedioate aldolase